MSKYVIKTGAFVTYGGDYSNDGDVLMFDQSLLSSDQWTAVWDMHESDRYDYVKAVLDGRHKCVPLLEGDTSCLCGAEVAPA
jgi:hypothetical protein